MGVTRKSYRKEDVWSCSEDRRFEEIIENKKKPVQKYEE